MRSFILISIILISHSCRCQTKISRQLVDLSWKNCVIEQMTKKYSSYANSRLNDSLNNYAADIYYKIKDINIYPFGDGYYLLKNEIEKKNIQFDSIICVSRQVVGLNPETLLGNNYFILVDDKLTMDYYHDLEKNKIIRSDHSKFRTEEMYSILINAQDGNDMSLILFTLIKQDWSFEISKVIINPYP